MMCVILLDGICAMMFLSVEKNHLKNCYFNKSQKPRNVFGKAKNTFIMHDKFHSVAFVEVLPRFIIFHKGFKLGLGSGKFLSLFYTY